MRDEELFWGGALSFTESQKMRLYKDRMNANRRSSHDYAASWHGRIAHQQPKSDFLTRMTYVEFRHRLPELLLMRVDKLSMATSIEARVPFLDHRLVEFSLSIPSRWHVKNGVQKQILKKAMEGILPPDIIHRKKQGFAAPINEWLRNEWSGFADDRLLNSYFVREGYFERDAVQGLISHHKQGSKSAGLNLWTLLNVSLWHRHWIEGKDV
jgi:asparagine synthase (glutamine-hydrolysing)